MARVRLLSTMGVAAVMARFEVPEGVVLEATYLPTVQLMARIRDGERGDVAILTGEGVDALVAEGVLEGRTDLARSFVGVAVRAGAVRPDIGSAEAFKAALLGARSVAMSMAGASGIFMAGLLERMGIAAAMRGKSIILERGYTAELAATGEAEIAIQQVSELMMVAGVDIVGRLPAALGGETMFAAGRFRGGDAGGEALIAALASPARAALYRSCGLEPAGTGAAMQA